MERAKLLVLVAAVLSFANTCIEFGYNSIKHELGWHDVHNAIIGVYRVAGYLAGFHFLIALSKLQTENTGED